MSLCGERSLVKSGAGESFAQPLYCRCWHCETCEPRRHRRFIFEACAGEPNRMLTLTVNPAIGVSQTDRRAKLARAFNHLIRKLRRSMPGKTIEYFVAVEETKAGEPHLHVLLRSPSIPHAKISAIMSELIDAPIVDIRAIDSVKKAAYYVAKYVSKAPAQFGTFKRYWQSRGWNLAPSEEWTPDTPQDVQWKVWGIPLGALLRHASYSGFAVRRHRGDCVRIFGDVSTIRGLSP